MSIIASDKKYQTDNDLVITYRGNVINEENVPPGHLLKENTPLSSPTALRDTNNNDSFNSVEHSQLINELELRGAIQESSLQDHDSQDDTILNHQLVEDQNSTISSNVNHSNSDKQQPPKYNLRPKHSRVFVLRPKAAIKKLGQKAIQVRN